jgi:hypothetical protein
MVTISNKTAFPSSAGKFLSEILKKGPYHRKMVGREDDSRQMRVARGLNRIIGINLVFLLLHPLLYTRIPGMLLDLHNAFANFLAAVTLAGIVGLWLCLDFLVPVYAEAKLQHLKPVTRPTGWLILLNSAALCGLATYWGLHHVMLAA